MLTREEVVSSYKLVLGRLPEDDYVIALHQPTESVQTFVNALIASQEFVERQERRRQSGDDLTPKRDEIVLAYRLLLGRLPESESAIEANRAEPDIARLIGAIMDSAEFRKPEDEHKGSSLDPIDAPTLARIARHRGAEYLAPRDLVVERPWPKHILLIGECLFDEWRTLLAAKRPETTVERVLFNNGSRLPDGPAEPFAAYDLQVVQVPLRSILPEQALLSLADDDEDGFARVFDQTCERLAMDLDAALPWADRVPTLVMNYMVPQQNPVGRLLPRYDLRNPVYFIERLNQELDREVRARSGCRLFDLDGAAATFGRRHVQDDSVWLTNHGGFLSNYDYPLDRERLERVGPMSDHYALDVAGFVELVFGQVVAAWRTLAAIDPVKMICFDLDDTLWRGVAAESAHLDPASMEGWPLGMIEALAMLKRRGIILALVSKNDPARVERIWQTLVGRHLPIDIFAIRKIGWTPKPESIASAIREANLLPSSVLFVDDNPAERGAVEAALPGIRTLGGSPYYWRRILLWSAETQVATISGESARRTDLIRDVAKREAVRTTTTRAEFLATLGLNIGLSQLTGEGDPRFGRAFELLNKTNQFNTTGRRWSEGEAREFLARGGVWWVFEVSDRFSDYGLVGVVILGERMVEQMVMSCRVFGLEVEVAVLARVLKSVSISPANPLTGKMVPTDANSPCRDIFARCGWRDQGNQIWSGSVAPKVPAHVVIV